MDPTPDQPELDEIELEDSECEETNNQDMNPPIPVSAQVLPVPTDKPPYLFHVIIYFTSLLIQLHLMIYTPPVVWYSVFLIRMINNYWINTEESVPVFAASGVVDFIIFIGASIAKMSNYIYYIFPTYFYLFIIIMIGYRWSKSGKALIINDPKQYVQHILWSISATSAIIAMACLYTRSGIDQTTMTYLVSAGAFIVNNVMLGYDVVYDTIKHPVYSPDAKWEIFVMKIPATLSVYCMAMVLTGIYIGPNDFILFIQYFSLAITIILLTLVWCNRAKVCS